MCVPGTPGCRSRPHARDRARAERVYVYGSFQTGLARFWRYQVHYLEVSDTGPVEHFVDLDELKRSVWSASTLSNYVARRKPLPDAEVEPSFSDREKRDRAREERVYVYGSR